MENVILIFYYVLINYLEKMIYHLSLPVRLLLLDFFQILGLFHLQIQCGLQ